MLKCSTVAVCRLTLHSLAKGHDVEACLTQCRSNRRGWLGCTRIDQQPDAGDRLSLCCLRHAAVLLLPQMLLHLHSCCKFTPLAGSALDVIWAGWCWAGSPGLLVRRQVMGAAAVVLSATAVPDAACTGPDQNINHACGAVRPAWHRMGWICVLFREKRSATAAAAVVPERETTMLPL